MILRNTAAILFIIISACNSIKAQKFSDSPKADENGFIVGLISTHVPYTMDSLSVVEVLSKLGYQVESIHIAPVFARIEADVLNEKQYLEVKNHDFIARMDTVRHPFDNDLYLRISNDMTEEAAQKFKKELLNLADNAGYSIHFKTGITRERAINFSSDHPEWKIHLSEPASNIARIKTEAGAEQKIMDEVLELDFVLDAKRIRVYFDR